MVLAPCASMRMNSIPTNASRCKAHSTNTVYRKEAWLFRSAMRPSLFSSYIAGRPGGRAFRLRKAATCSY